MEAEEKVETKKKGKWWIYAIIVLLIIIIVLLLLKSCGNGKSDKYKIKLHYGDEVIEVDENFKLSDLEVEGGKVSFLVDSDGHIVDPDSKLDSKKEYSTHLIPDGKEKVKVTYVVGDKKTVYEYQKGAGLLFPEDPKKEGYVFLGWYDEDINDYPIYMTPVDHNMVLYAVFDESITEDGKCTLNCDTNNDGSCDLNCDINKDGKPDTNVDTDGDGKPDINIDVNGDGKCDVNCDTDNDGKCDKDCQEKVEFTYRTQQGQVVFSCKKHGPNDPLYLAFTIVDGEYSYFKVDGKEYQPVDENSLYFDVTEFRRSGKTVMAEGGYVTKDSVGQKYFNVLYAEVFFEANCDKNVNEITYKCEDYDDEGGFFFASPVKEDKIKSIKVDGEEIKVSKYEEDYPVYDLSDFFEDEKILNIEIEYTTPDGNGNTSYNVKVIFPKCEFGVSEYTLTLDANGGSVNPASRVLYRGQVLSDLPTPTRKGYQFEGWYTEKNGGSLIVEDTTTMPDSDMTIYAHWESNETPKQESKIYTLTYNANGGSVSPKNKAIKEGASYGSLPTPTRSGYTFDGWYTNASGGSKVSSSTKMTKDTTIYAHWTKNEEPTPTPTPTPEPEPDNGTISLSVPNKCLIQGQGVRVSAVVSNAKDSTIDWLGDTCLSLISNDNVVTVTGRSCSAHPTLTGRLHNGAKDTVTFDYENTLTITVKDMYDKIVNPSNGIYEGNSLEIITNVPAYITGINLLGDASTLRKSAKTSGAAQTEVTITTPCGQTKTISIYPIIH